MKPEFGNQEHIALRDAVDVEAIWQKLRKKVKCPHCGRPAIEYFDYDIKEQQMGINFACVPRCPNSIEYCEKHGYDDCDVWFDFNGRHLEEI